MSMLTGQSLPERSTGRFWTRLFVLVFVAGMLLETGLYIIGAMTALAG